MLSNLQDTILREGFGVYGITYMDREGACETIRFRSNDRVNIYSGAKTFTALAVMLCVEEGLLTLDDSIVRFFPQYEDCFFAGTEKVTIRHMLHMADGKPCAWFARPLRDTITKDIALLYLQEPLVCTPGTVHNYSSACTYMLGRAVEAAAGCTVRDYLNPRVFRKLGIQNAQWLTCPLGHTLCSTGLLLTTEEYARLGMLFVNKGFYKGQRVIGGHALTQMFNDTIYPDKPFAPDAETNVAYGYQLWHGTKKGIFRADGMYAQLCVFSPETGRVVAVTAHEEKRPYDILRAVYRVFENAGS